MDGLNNLIASLEHHKKYVFDANIEYATSDLNLINSVKYKY